MELKIPAKFKDTLGQNSALTGLVNTAISEFGEWLKQNNVKLFSEYTDHSLEHVEKVLETAHDLIRDECRAFITPHDVATLILAILLHDTAMHISEDGFANLVKEDSKSIINGFQDKPWSRLWADYLAESRRFSGRKLIELFGEAEPVRHPPLDDLQQLNGRDLLLCGEFLRRHHPRLAHEIALFGVPGPSGRILNIPTTEDTAHVVDLAGLIARSHGLSIRDCFEYLQSNYSSIKMVRGIHPVFLMALLRIADILQIQPSRAPKQVLKIRQLKSPISNSEWEMHQSIKDISFKEFPETLWVVAKPENAKTYLKVRRLLDQIQFEFDSSWTVIGEVYGYDPEFREFGLKIRRIRSNIDDLIRFSKQVSYIPVQASFEVADTDLLKLLIGPLYGEKAEVGIRELMQNSIDAVIERKNFNNQHNSHLQENSILEQKDIEVSINKNNDDEWWFTISDNGMGMTLSTVKDYFLKAGASLRRSELWKKTFEDEFGKSKILRSGRFGVGALAAFLIGEEIKVTTRHISAQHNEGLEFTAKIDTVSIEIKNLDRPIGTTISIKLKENAKNSLIPASTETEYEAEQKHKKWDWYCLDHPVVVRKFNEFELKQSYILPKLSSQLPDGWRRIKHDEYEDIQWTYLRSTPPFTCNGIIVKPDENRSLSIYTLKDKYINFGRPNISIFDFNANFPLNIQRTDITTSEFPFHKILLESIIKDFFAYLLTETPISETISENLKYHPYKNEYYTEIEDNQYINFFFSAPKIPFWVSTKNGISAFCDPNIFNKLGKKSALVNFTYDGDTGDNPVVDYEPIIWAQFRRYTNIADNLIHAIATGLGISIDKYFIDSTFGVQLSPYGNKIKGSRVLVNKKVFNILKEIKDYSSVQFEIIHDYDNIALAILDQAQIKNMNYQNYKTLISENMREIEKEWEDNNWIIFKIGDCPEFGFDFKKITNLKIEENIQKWCHITAEWYFQDTETRFENSMFSKLWDEILQSPIIPYDLAERKDKLHQAYNILKEDIEKYLVTKTIIEQQRKIVDSE